MHKSFLAPLLPLLLDLCNIPTASALNFPFHGRTITRSISQPLARRQDGDDEIGTSPISGDDVSIPVSNTHNAQYISNITLGGVEVPVLLDTGSSDLWVHFIGDQPQAQELGTTVNLRYAVGRASGHVHTAEFKIDDYTLADQVFLKVTDTSTFSSDIHAQGYSGLIGLGPNAGSVILEEMDDVDSANTALERLFQQFDHKADFITFLLDRKGDPSPDFTGQMTISEYIQGFEGITKQPKMEIHEVHRLLDSDQHWQILTDKDSAVIGPDGKVVKVKSIVPRAPKGRLVSVVDTGFTFTQVPRELSDAIYGRVRGAIYDAKNEWWTVPCGQELNISFNFGGINYPIHPLDTVNDNFGIRDANGEKICIGTFQPITSAFSMLGNYDMILGMNFLRNTYTLLSFGNWVDTAPKGTPDPYVQMISVTKADEMHADFVKVRLEGTAGANADWSLLPEDQMQHSPISDEEKKKKYQEMILSRWPYIFVGCLVFVLLVVGFIVWRCCCRRQAKEARAAKKAAKEAKTKGGLEGGALPYKRSSYAPLQDSASSYSLSAYNTNNNTNNTPQYDTQQYQNTPSPYSSQPNTAYSGGQQSPYYQETQQHGHYQR